MRTIKLHAWEGEFEERIAELRRVEVGTLLWIKRISALDTTMFFSMPIAASLACFLLKSRVFPPYEFSAAQGFTAITLFYMLSGSLTYVPYILSSATRANVAIQRVSRFLALPEVDGRDGHHLDMCATPILTGDDVEQVRCLAVLDE